MVLEFEREWYVFLKEFKGDYYMEKVVFSWSLDYSLGFREEEHTRWRELWICLGRCLILMGHICESCTQIVSNCLGRPNTNHFNAREKNLWVDCVSIHICFSLWKRSDSLLTMEIKKKASQSRCLLTCLKRRV